MPVDVLRPFRVVLAVVLAWALVLALAPAMPALAAAHSKPSHSKRSHRAAHHRRRPIHRRHVIAAPSASGAATTQAQTGPCADTELIPAPENLDRIAAATLCLVNQQREAHGETPLRQNAALTAAANRHSLDMVARDYFAHVSPSGVDPLARLLAIGYVLQNATFRIGENIGDALGAFATPAATVDRWMHSPEHRANILNGAYRDSGIGVAPAAPSSLGSGPGATYTQEFGG